MPPDGGGRRDHFPGAADRERHRTLSRHARNRERHGHGRHSRRRHDERGVESVSALAAGRLVARRVGLSTDLYGVETEAHGVLHAIWETSKAEQFVGGTVIK